MSKNDDSLDFTPQEPAKPAAAAPKRPQPKRAAEPPKAPPRKVGLPVLIAGAIILAVVFFMARESSNEVAPPPQAKKKAAAPAPKTAPKSKAAQPYPPPVATPTPPQAPAPGVESRVLPPDFLKAVQQYNTKAGFKAMSLALDTDGKYAYGTITGWPTQAGANEEALAECEKFKVQSKAQSTCRLFAVGDRVVW